MTTRVRELATQMVKRHTDWGPKLNVPGALLTLNEASPRGANFVYRLYANGLPHNQIYTILQWPSTQLEPGYALSGVTFDEAGQAVCAGKPGTCGDPAKPNDPIAFTFFPVKGEPFRLAVVADDDQKLRAFVKVVPIPIAAEDKGCRLEAVLLMPHAELVLVQATNFPPNADLVMTGDSEGEIHKTQSKSDGEGEYVSAVLPAKVGLKSGTIKIRVEAPTCSPQVSVPWTVQTGKPNQISSILAPESDAAQQQAQSLK